MILNQISEKIVKHFIEKQIIKEEDATIYLYGVHQGIMLVINLVTTCIIAVVSGMIWETFLLSLAYLSLRPYAGGYHSRSQFRCYLLSILLFVVMLVAVEWMPKDVIVILSMLGGSAGVIFKLAPVEDENKPLDDLEVKIYGKKSRTLTGIQVVSSVVLCVMNYNRQALCIAIALVAVSIMLILGGLRNHRQRKVYIECE